MKMQAGYDLWEARRGKSREKIERVEPVGG
jgi:plasmid maintenance system antidote protein VapI